MNLLICPITMRKDEIKGHLCRTNKVRDTTPALLMHLLSFTLITFFASGCNSSEQNGHDPKASMNEILWTAVKGPPSRGASRAFPSGTIYHYLSPYEPAFGAFCFQNVPETWKQSNDGRMLVLSKYLKYVLPSYPQKAPDVIPFLPSLPVWILELNEYVTSLELMVDSKRIRDVDSQRVQHDKFIRRKRAHSALDEYIATGVPLPDTPYLMEALELCCESFDFQSLESMYRSAIDRITELLARKSMLESARMNDEEPSSSTLPEFLMRSIDGMVGRHVGPYHVVKHGRHVFLEPFFSVIARKDGIVLRNIGIKTIRLRKEINPDFSNAFVYLIGRICDKNNRHISTASLDSLLEQLEFLVWNQKHPITAKIYDHRREIAIRIHLTIKMLSKAHDELSEEYRDRMIQIVSCYFDIENDISDFKLLKHVATLTGQLLVHYAVSFKELTDLGFVPVVEKSGVRVPRMERTTVLLDYCHLFSGLPIKHAISMVASFKKRINQVIDSAPIVKSDHHFMKSLEALLAKTDATMRMVRTENDLRLFMGYLSRYSVNLSKQFAFALERAGTTAESVAERLGTIQLH